MANVVGERILGNLAYFDYGAHRRRLVDAIGPDVVKFILKPGDFQGNGDTGTDPNGGTTTVVEVGAGTSELHGTTEAGALAEMLTAANDNDGIQVQWGGESFEMTTNQGALYFGVELKCTDATQSDFLMGLAMTDTTVLGGVDTAIYFECLDGSTTINIVVEKNTTETTTALGTAFADDTYTFLEFYYDGSNLQVFQDGVELTTAIATTNFPNDEALRPTMAFLNGAAGAETLTIRKFLAIQIGLT